METAPDEGIKARGNDKLNGHLGWLLTAGLVAGWDMSNNETMTSAASRGIYNERPAIRYATRAALAVTALHLMRRIPTEVDPFDNISRGVARIRDRYLKPQ